MKRPFWTNRFCFFFFWSGWTITYSKHEVNISNDIEDRKITRLFSGLVSIALAAGQALRASVRTKGGEEDRRPCRHSGGTLVNIADREAIYHPWKAASARSRYAPVYGADDAQFHVPCRISSSTSERGRTPEA